MVPMYNEEERLPVMMEEALRYVAGRAAKQPGFSFEFILVDDGSKDKTVQVRTVSKTGRNHLETLVLNLANVVCFGPNHLGCRSWPRRSAERPGRLWAGPSGCLPAIAGGTAVCCTPALDRLIGILTAKKNAKRVLPADFLTVSALATGGRSCGCTRTTARVGRCVPLRNPKTSISSQVLCMSAIKISISYLGVLDELVCFDEVGCLPVGAGPQGYAAGPWAALPDGRRGRRHQGVMTPQSIHSAR